MLFDCDEDVGRKEVTTVSPVDSQNCKKLEESVPRRTAGSDTLAGFSTEFFRAFVDSCSCGHCIQRET